MEEYKIPQRDVYKLTFVSKTQFIEHYLEMLGASHIGGHILAIETKAALKLIDKYFKDK